VTAIMAFNRKKQSQADEDFGLAIFEKARR